MPKGDGQGGNNPAARKANPYGYAPDKIVAHPDTGEVCGYVPTPEEIEARAAAIRDEWGELRWSKQYGAPKPVELYEAAKPSARKEKRKD